jgi:hypothetical protein
MAILNGTLYVAWTERTAVGHAQLYVKSFDGANWTMAGAGSLNKNTATGAAFRPTLIADEAGGALYIGWVEQQDIGQRAQVWISKFNGTAWTPVGGVLNVDPLNGSAQRTGLTIADGAPVAIWGEVNLHSTRQVFAKRWSGSTWTALSGTSGPPLTACDLNGDTIVNVIDMQIAIKQAIGVSACTTADLQRNGVCNVVDVQRVIVAATGGACVTGQ